MRLLILLGIMFLVWLVPTLWFRCLISNAEDCYKEGVERGKRWRNRR